MSSLRSRNKIRTCCICLTTTFTNGLTIDRKSPWLETYSFCFGVTMNIDNTPRKMCGNCQEKLKEFSEFKKIALRSDKLWKCVINPNSTNTKSKVSKPNVRNGNHDLKKFDATEVICIDDDDDDGDNKLIKKEEIDDDFTYIENINEEQSICFTCGCVFDTETDYNDHLNICVKKEENLEEPNTLTSFTDEDLESYVLRSARRRRCRVGNTNINEKKIIKEKKLQAPSQDCGLCNETFSDTAEFKLHLTDHGARNDLCCKLCDFQGRDFADMVTHRLSHLSTEYKVEIRCHLCHKKCANAPRLQYHYRSVHLHEKGGKCSICNKSYSTYKKWVNHERLHVTARYICDVCGRRFLFRYEIIEHLKIHFKTNEFICEICGKAFYKKSNFKLHLATMHKINKIKCTHCNKIYKNEQSFKKHMRTVTSERLYQCEFCPKTFTLPCYLKSHVIWHLDAREFVCAICGVGYKSRQCLKNHMSKHTGHLPFKCEQCTKCFKTSTQLKVHMSVHTGVRRHKCPHCPRSFHGRCMLMQHLTKCKNALSSKLTNSEPTVLS